MKAPKLSRRTKINLNEIVKIIINLCKQIDLRIKEIDNILYLKKYEKFIDAIEISMAHLTIDEPIRIDLLKIFYDAIKEKYVDGECFSDCNDLLDELNKYLIKIESFIDDYEAKAIELTKKIKEDSLLNNSTESIAKSLGIAIVPESQSADDTLDLNINVKEEYTKYLEKHLRLLKRAQREIEVFKEEKESLLKQTSDSVYLVKNIIQDLEREYDSKILYLQLKKKEVDDQVSLLSGKMINSEYATQSLSEKNTADVLRVLSLSLLLLVVLIIGYSFYEATLENFTMEKTLIRISFSLILTIPAAYLARESNKHRQQQQGLRNTALALKAIDPYLSSLPENEKYKIKSRFASKIFGSPINTNINESASITSAQQLLEKLIEKTEKTEKTDEEFSLPINSNKLLAKIIERLVKEESENSANKK